MSAIEPRVIEIVAEELSVEKDKIRRDTTFIQDLGADSLDIVSELVMALEEEFDINNPDDQAEKFTTVGEASDHIEKEASDS